MATTNKTDVYQIVTDRILRELEKGNIPWQKPWLGLHVTWEAVEEADAIVRAYPAGSGVKLTEEPGSDRAFYSPLLDSVTIPCRAQFKDRAEFYSTEFHELVHSTGHSSRLDRFSTPGDHTFGGEEYSKE